MFTSSEIIAAAEARVGVTDEDPPAIRRNLDHLVRPAGLDQRQSQLQSSQTVFTADRHRRIVFERLDKRL